MSVHSKFNVPYFDSILKPTRKLIPDYLPKYPDVDRFGTVATFKDVFVKAGYDRIVVKNYYSDTVQERFQTIGITTKNIYQSH